MLNFIKDLKTLNILPNPGYAIFTTIREGDSCTVTVVVAKGDPLHPPRVKWVKGKWNEITGGEHYGIAVDENNHTLTFKSPKMTDSGLYTVKVFSTNTCDTKTFDLKVGPEKSGDAGIVIVRGKLP